MKIGICGIAGRMGRAILAASLEKGHTISQGLDAPQCPMLGQDVGSAIGKKLNVAIESLPDTALNADAIIDFSAPAATEVLLHKAVQQKIPLVIGTTGFSDAQKERIQKASDSIPIVFSPNMSVGVNLLFKLTQLAASVLKQGYDVEIFEAHHRLKKDSPSGTAKKLIDIVMETRKDLHNAKLMHGREGIVGERTDNEIGVMVMRGGDIVGEHTVYFIASGERIELTHRATSRDNFARGAVMAAEFIVNKKPGLYTMFDVLGL
ncbi:MAG: 4-hydroxy-tetrahydrodipicolinate reductase [Spirochaetes bacterium]|nr:4-hydroxy-tetrahydrodipicolinate reductase [Spirochaetota bacterium]